MKTLKIVAVALALMLLVPLAVQAGWLDGLKKEADKHLGAGSGSASALSDSEVVSGLKEALGVAVDNSVSFLKKPGGYLDNAKVRIPMPKHLRTAEKAARAIGQDEMADEFITSMNRAAERAVGETVAIFTSAIKKMSFSDARGILSGADDAATQYFKRTSTQDLLARIRPIVEKATSAVGVTQKYKSFMGSAGSLGSLMNTKATDLDGYVTEQAVAGLFTVVADEEKKIRENPAARTTALLKKVFGSGQ